MAKKDDRGRRAEVIRLENQLRHALDESTHAKEQAEELQQLLSEFFQYNPVLSFIKDEQGRYLYGSKSFARFFDVEPESFLGKTDFEWLPEHLARQFTDNDNQVRATGQPIETIESVEFPSGTIHSIVCKFPIHMPSGRLFVGGTAVDITAQEAAEKLRKHLTQELQQARDEALRASKVKSTFLSCMSHELRTPLSAIQVANQLLLNTSLEKEQLMLANIIKTSSESLLQMVTDVLDLTAIESSRMAVVDGPFSPASVLQETFESFKSQLESKGLKCTIAIEAGVPDVVVGDAGKVKKILAKLMDNAVKFTESGTVALKLEAPVRTEQTTSLRFCVEDSGIGIAQEEFDNLFLPFTQLDSSSSRKYGGTGLGLALAKSLLEMMDGRFEVKSEAGKGSTFSFTIEFDKCNDSQKEDA